MSECRGVTRSRMRQITTCWTIVAAAQAVHNQTAAVGAISPHANRTGTSPTTNPGTDLHILAYSDGNACLMRSCWTRWINRMLHQDRDYRYHLHIESAPIVGHADAETTGSALYRSRNWITAVIGKIVFVLDVLRHAIPEGDVVVFTDLDVVPFRPFSVLVPLLTEHRAHLLWMYNPHWRHNKHVNTGFYVLANTPPVRWFFEEWNRSVNARTVDDQNNAHAILYSSAPRKHSLVWKTLPLHTVTYNVSQIQESSIETKKALVGFHCIGSLDKINTSTEVIEAMRTDDATTGSMIWKTWQKPCSRHAARAECDLVR